MVLGLILLQTTSEELACPREDLSVARKQELHKLLLVEVPNMLSILNSKYFPSMLGFHKKVNLFRKWQKKKERIILWYIND